MRIIIDAMGGDHAPDEIVLGAVDAAKEFDADLVLVGRGAAILEALRRKGISTLPKRVEIANAEDVVDMHDNPSTVVRKRKDSSMVVGLRMIAEGQGDAFISAGSTGALLAAATLIVKRVPGIRRAAMAPMIPTAKGRCVLIDCGANAECTPEFLLQFACMGSFFAKAELKLAEPRVALLNIGTESEKGTTLQQQTYPMLQSLSEAGVIHFIGNLEARDVPLGGADVVVADGFSGNVLLKSIEGTAKLMSTFMKDMFEKNWVTKLGAVCCKGGINQIKTTMDYRQVGGTALLGIAKPVIKAHGASDSLAIYHAVRQAISTVKGDMAGQIAENISLMTVSKEIEHAQ